MQQKIERELIDKGFSAFKFVRVGEHTRRHSHTLTPFPGLDAGCMLHACACDHDCASLARCTGLFWLSFLQVPGDYYDQELEYRQVRRAKSF